MKRNNHKLPIFIIFVIIFGILIFKESKLNTIICSISLAKFKIPKLDMV